MKRFCLLCLAFCLVSSPAFSVDPVTAGKLALEAGTLLYRAYKWWKNDDGKKADEELQRRRAASMTVLMEAAHKESIEDIARLLRAGEIINAKDYDGDTALTYAIAGNTPEVVKFLIDSGAYVNERILGYALIRNEPEILAITLEKNFDKKVLNKSLAKIKLDGLKFGIVKELMKFGADINYKDEDNNNETLLMRLVRNEGSNPKFVRAIIESGASVSLRNSDGMNSLMYAAKYNKNIEMTRVLLREFYTGSPSLAFKSTKPSINTRDDNGRTALMYAAESNTDKIVNLLIDSGSDVTIRDNEGNKAVDYALGWLGGNSLVKGTGAFERLGTSDNWVRPYW
ncbi:MAG: ankyrin repeat domain-containing protein [Synergistaceae bacterium]|nr:ankyrin repeat domain-containing protein [Synergistaceae bacterium]